MRQDAVMQQVFTVMKSLLRTSKEAKQRKLHVRTYKVVPLSAKSGVLEWCINTKPVGEIIINAHLSHYPEDYKPRDCLLELKANSEVRYFK